MQQRNRNGVAISTSHCGLFCLIKEACGEWLRSGIAGATAHRDDVMASEEKKARRQRQEEEENANKTEKEEAEPATADEQLNLDKKPEDDIMEEERWKREQNDSSEGTNDTNTGEDGVMSSEISIKFPEQTA